MSVEPAALRAKVIGADEVTGDIAVTLPGFSGGGSYRISKVGREPFGGLWAVPPVDSLIHVMFIDVRSRELIWVGGGMRNMGVLGDYYTKSEIDTALGDYYTKTETDIRYVNETDEITIPGLPSVGDYDVDVENDWLLASDTSDTTDDPGGTAKKISPINLLLLSSSFPDEITRGTAVPNPRDGQRIYVEDSHRWSYWDDGAGEWVWDSGTDEWTSAQPVFTASTTNPALGTGGQLRVGRMKRTTDGLIAFRFSIRFGDSGAGAGSGNYFVEAPAAAHLLNGTAADTVVGTVWGFDFSASRWMPFRLQGDWSMRLDNGNGFVSSGNPWTWGAGDRLQGSLLYEPA